MEHLKIYLRETYQLSNYQIAQIFFLFKTMASEISKIVIMGILFHNDLTFYLFALFIMCALRSVMGGLHFYTYIKCLSTSILYMWLALYILPSFVLPRYGQIMALLLCILICNHIGPITSKYRPAECKKIFRKCTKLACTFIFTYTLFIYVIPENEYLLVGFWVIILHSLQLTVAKILKKGEHSK